MILLLSLLLSASVVAVDEMPRPMQFYPRDANDSATVRVSGRVLDPRCSGLKVELLRDERRVSETEVATVDAAGGARFATSVRIAAELAQYTVRLHGRIDGEWAMLSEAAGLLAGDVYMIAGQSNAHPTDPRATWTSPFIRSLGMETGNSNYDRYDPADTLFGIGNGDGMHEGEYGPFLVGVWGMRMAQHLIEETGIPVFIINGGAGGSPIEDNLRDDASPMNLETVYGRTLYRFERSGLREHVRVIFWHQGESNHIWHYAGNIRELYEDWRQDYPSVDRHIVFQIRPGCGGNHAELRELQRTLDDTLPTVHPIATVGLPGHDGCHFTYEGYLAMGDLAYDVLMHDARSPDVVRAWYTTTAHDEVAVLFRSSAGIVWQPDTVVAGELRTLASAFMLDDLESLVESGRVDGDTVRLKLRAPTNARRLGYVPNKFYPGTETYYEGPWLVDTNGRGAFTFANIPIEDPPSAPVTPPPAPPTPDLTLRAAPSPTTGSVTVAFGLEADGHVRLTIVDEAGRSRTILDGVKGAGPHAIAVDDLPAGAYRCVLTSGARSESIPIVVVH